MGSYRKVLDLEAMRSVIKMIKRMGWERVKESGKYGGIGERKSEIRGGVCGYGELFHSLFLHILTNTSVIVQEMYHLP